MNKQWIMEIGAQRMEWIKLFAYYCAFAWAIMLLTMCAIN